MNNTMLEEAYSTEAKDIDIQELMQDMLNNFQQETNYEPNPFDEVKIRKLMLARKYILKDIQHIKQLRDAIIQEWNDRIERKEKEINDINNIIEYYIKHVNNGQKLSFDIGTATLRRNAPKAKVVDKIKAREYLQQIGELDKYLKAPELDTTLLQKTYINEFKSLVEQKASEKIEFEKEANGGKITKKREKEILLETEQQLADHYFKQLPDFVEYIPESQTLSITIK